MKHADNTAILCGWLSLCGRHLVPVLKEEVRFSSRAFTALFSEFTGPWMSDEMTSNYSK